MLEFFSQASIWHQSPPARINPWCPLWHNCCLQSREACPKWLARVCARRHQSLPALNISAPGKSAPGVANIHMICAHICTSDCVICAHAQMNPSDLRLCAHIVSNMLFALLYARASSTFDWLAHASRHTWRHNVRTTSHWGGIELIFPILRHEDHNQRCGKRTTTWWPKQFFPILPKRGQGVVPQEIFPIFPQKTCSNKNMVPTKAGLPQRLVPTKAWVATKIGANG